MKKLISFTSTNQKRIFGVVKGLRKLPKKIAGNHLSILPQKYFKISNTPINLHIFRLQIRHILSEPLESWSGEVGRMSERISNGLAALTSTCYSTFCLVCGPAPFNELCQKLLGLAGFQDNELHFFYG